LRHQLLRLDGKAAGVAAEVEDRFIFAERGEKPAVVALIAEEAGFYARCESTRKRVPNS